MKKVFLAFLLVALMASFGFAKVGVEFGQIIGGNDPTFGLSAAEGQILGSPLILPLNKLSLVWDATDAIIVFGGINQYNITTGDTSMFGADTGNKSTGLGAHIGLKVRLAKGNLVPVLGGCIRIASISADDANAEAINASMIEATAGFEYTITPGLLLIGDATIIDIISGTVQWNGGDNEQMDSITRILPGGSLGLRWYFI